MKKDVKKGDVAITGQYLGVVEEYLPNKESTYVKDGIIYATKTGLVKIDDNKRQIEIETKRQKVASA